MFSYAQSRSTHFDINRFINSTGYGPSDGTESVPLIDILSKLNERVKLRKKNLVTM